MKQIILLCCLCLVIVLNTQAQNFISQYQQLVSVNEQWKYQPDVDFTLKTTVAKPLPEQQLVQFHLQEVEKLLRRRTEHEISALTKEKRLLLLDVLHQYTEAGVFPINNLHEARQPYFIDANNTYCAVGYLMKMSGADKTAREIHDTQNFSYLLDIRHPQLMDWVSNSGFTLTELALIQPGYGDEMPPALMEMHYNNQGTDVNEYIEIKQGNYTVTFNQVLFYNQNSTLYKTLPIAQMQTFGNLYYSYTFPSNESFADVGYIELRNNNTVITTINYNNSSIATTGRVNHMFNDTTLTYNVGESETTPVGNSLSFTGRWGTSSWNLVSATHTMNAINLGVQFPMPVALSKFDYLLNNKQVTLLWETTAELNNKYFTIEKSTDGINFFAIGTVNGAGNSNSVKKYSFTDYKPGYTNHYRLKQIDFDGKAITSKMIFVKVLHAAPVVLVQNVVNSQLEVLIQQEIKGAISIYDFSGKLVKQVQVNATKQIIDVSTLKSGSYLFSWQSNHQDFVNLVFQKM